MPAQRPDHGFASRVGVLTATVALIVGLMIPTAVLAAPPGISLEQCRNGSATDPNDCENLGGSSGWVNGNVGASQGHLLEGYSIPYRALITNAPTGTPITVTLGYDIKHGGANAIDYLTHYDRLESHAFFGHSAEDVIPSSGTGLDPLVFDTEPIDPPSSAGSPVAGQPGASFAALPADQKVMTLYGGTFVDDSFAYVTQGSLTASQSETQISVTFTLTSSTAVLAWGGHIARGDQWDGASASAISGSPYHMRLKAWTLGNVGNQDRSLSAGAVQAGPSTTSTQPTATFSVTINDSATITGDSPTGNVVFRLYDTAENCGFGGDTVGSGGLLYKQTVALSGGTASTDGTGSGSNVVTAAGTYVWSVNYEGDGANAPSSSLCVEKVTVTAPTIISDPAS